MIRRGVLCLIVLALAPAPLWVHDHLTCYGSVIGSSLGIPEAQRETDAIERQLRLRVAQQRLAADPGLVVELRRDSRSQVVFAPIPAAEAARVAGGATEQAEAPTLLPRSFAMLPVPDTPIEPKDLAFVPLPENPSLPGYPLSGAAPGDAIPARFAALILPETTGPAGPGAIHRRVFWNVAQLHEASDTLQASMEHAEQLRSTAAAGSWALLAVALALAIWTLGSRPLAVSGLEPRPASRVTVLVSERQVLLTLALCALSLPWVCMGLLQLPFFWEEPLLPLAYLGAAVLALAWCMQHLFDRVVLRGAIAASVVVLGAQFIVFLGRVNPGRFAPFLWRDPIFPVVYLATAALLILSCVRAAVKGVVARRGITVMGTVLVVAGAGVALRSCYASSELWMRRQTDVRWHRDWQDLHRRDELDTAVGDIYRKLRLAHPDDPDWNYLALRAQPTEVEKRDAFVTANEAFPENAWLAWNAGTMSGDLPRLLFAVKSLSPLPTGLIEDTITLCTRDRNWPALKALWESQPAIIRTDVDLAASMSVADLVRGDRDGASQWSALAQGLEGQTDHPTIWLSSPLGSIDRLRERLGWRPDLVGSATLSEATGDHGRLEIVSLHAQDAAGSARLGYDPAISSYLNTLGERGHRGLEGLGGDPYANVSPKLQTQIQTGSLMLAFLIKYKSPGLPALLGGPPPTFTLRTLDGQDLTPAEQGPKGDLTQLTFLLPSGAQVSELVATIGTNPPEARLRLDLKPQPRAGPIVGVRPD